MNKEFEILGCKFEINDFNVHSVEKNEYNKKGNITHSTLTFNDGKIIETDMEYDSLDRLISVKSTLPDKDKMMVPRSKSKQMPNTNNITLIEYDADGNISEISKNGYITDTFRRSKSGNRYRISDEVTEEGLLRTLETTDIDGNVIKRIDILNDTEEVYKFNKSNRRGTIIETGYCKTDGGSKTFKLHYKMKDGKQIFSKMEERESATGYRYEKKMIDIRYNDNNDLEYIASVESINGINRCIEEKYIYRDGKLHSVIDDAGVEQDYFFEKDGYSIHRAMPTDIMAMLAKQYIYSIEKKTKTTNFSFYGNTRNNKYSYETEKFKCIVESNLGIKRFKEIYFEHGDKIYTLSIENNIFHANVKKIKNDKIETETEYQSRNYLTFNEEFMELEELKKYKNKIDKIEKDLLGILS